MSEDSRAAFEKWYYGHHDYAKKDRNLLAHYWDDDSNFGYTDKYIHGCFIAYLSIMARQAERERRLVLYATKHSVLCDTDEILAAFNAAEQERKG